MAKWKKTSPWGDYKDPLQNHKFDGDLHFTSEKDSTLKVYTRISNILHEAKWYFGKHIGSKKLSNIIAFNRKANSTRAAIKKAVNKENNASEESSK